MFSSNRVNTCRAAASQLWTKLPQGYQARLCRYPAILEDDIEPAVLMTALRHVTDAYGGVGKLAEAAGIHARRWTFRREVLYRALSPNGNPTIKTFLAVIKAPGLKVEINLAPHAHA